MAVCVDDILRLCVLLSLGVVLGVSGAHAQTGPGGVGTDDGTSNLKLWLDAGTLSLDNGDPVDTWADQSGYDNDATENTSGSEAAKPSFSNSVLNGEPAVDFDGSTADALVGSSVLAGGTTGRTIFTVFTTTETGNTRVFALNYNLDGSDGNVLTVTPEVSVRTKGTNYKVFSSAATSDGSTGNVLTVSNPSNAQVQDLDAALDGSPLAVNNTSGGTTSIDVKGDDYVVGGLDGFSGPDVDVAAVAAYDRELNGAEQTIVENYLSTKYGITIAGDKYAHDTNHGTDLAGIGRSSSGSHLSSNSSILNLNTGSLPGDGDYAFFGHDGAGASSFSFASTAPLSEDADNDTNADAERMSRRWRVDLTSLGGTTTLTANVEKDKLPSKTSNYDYVVIVGNKNDFSGSPTVYDLNNAGDTDGDGTDNFTGSVTVDDGDYVTIGAVKRVVQFAGADGSVSTVDASAVENVNSGNEGNAAETDGTATLALNYPYTDGTTASIAFAASGTEAPAGNPGSADFDAAGPGDPGSGSDGDGSNNDFDVNTSSPVNVGNTKDISLEIHDDGAQEQTQYFKLTIDANNTTGAAAGDNGGDGTVPFVFGINDNDEPRKLSFSNATNSENEGEGGGTRAVSLTVDLNDTSNSGKDASKNEPCTSVRFEVDGAASDVIIGDVTNKKVPDVQIDGSQSTTSGCSGEYQTRDADGKGGRLYFEEDQTSATVEVVVNEDEINDFDTEDLKLDLSNPISGALSGTASDLTTTLTLTDDPGGSNDDPAPDVVFKNANSSGDESTSSPSFTVETVCPSSPEGCGSQGTATPSSRPVEVPFAFDSGNSSATKGGSDDFTISTESPLVYDETAGGNSGESSKTITLSVTDDSKREGDETVEIDLQSGGGLKGANLGGTTTHTYTIVGNDQPNIGATGPGGVGAADGTGRLKLWLRSDTGLFTGTGCSSPAGGGDNVGCWADQSGYGNDATENTSGSEAAKPSVSNSVLNGEPAVDFAGSTADALVGSSVLAGGTTGRTIFTVFTTTETTNSRVFALNYSLTGGDGGLLTVTPEISARTGGGNYRVFSSGATDDGTTGNLLTVSNPTEAEVQDLDATLDGSALGVQTTSGPGTSIDIQGNDYSVGGLDGFNGPDINVAAVAVYDTQLFDARKTIIENHLAAKYGIGTITNDKYAGDQSGNGDYDLGVFGIGQKSGSDFHNKAEAEGLRFDTPSGLDDGDYLLAGHRTAVNVANASDISGVSGTLERRFERAWYIDRTEPSTSDLSANVTFDLSEAGLDGTAGAKANYVLIQRAADASAGTDWSVVDSKTSADAVSGDEITFTGVSLPDGQEVTLGTTDAANSPLDANNLVVEGTAGIDGSDQGWRFLGLPVTGGTAGDLQRQNGSQFIDVRVNMAYTNPGGSVNKGSGDDGWTVVDDASTAFTNGRGFIVWLYDNVSYPLDPNITLQTAGGLSGPGGSNVTVGSGSADDPTLSQSDKQYLLANPYAVPFDLGSLNGNGFDSAVQVWKPNATSPSGQDDGNAGSFVTRSRSGNDNVASWQGFLLTRSSAGSGDTQVTFNSSGRAPAATPGLVGSKAATETAAPTKHRVPLRLVGRDDGTLTALDKAVSVLFHEDATDGRDHYDAPKFEPMTESYATLAPVAANSDTTLRAQESRPLPRGSIERVPLSMQQEGVGGTFEIAMPSGGEVSTETPSIPDGWTVTLKDTKGTADPSDDETHLLTPGGAPYTFEAVSDKAASKAQESPSNSKAESPDGKAEEAGPPDAPRPTLRRLSRSGTDRPAAKTKAATGGAAASPRFTLMVEPADALPVELAEMNARRDGERAVLSWKTASETSNAGFQVQHQRLPAGDTSATPAAADWQNLGFVEGAGTTTEAQSYRHETAALDYGRHVFRLKQVDAGGAETATEPVEVQMRLDESYAVEAPYPNPARQEATLPVTVRESQEVTVSLYDVLGRRVQVVRDRELQGQDTRPIALPVRQLASGTYFVRVRGDEFTATRRLTVVR